MMEHVVLSAAIVASAILAIEARSALKSVAFFCLTCVLVALAMGALGAIYVAVFQLAVYAGGVTVLLLTALSFKEPKLPAKRESLVAAVTAIAVLAVLLAVLSPPPATPSSTSFTEKPYFLWTYRWVDVLVQAAIVFASVMAVYVLLFRFKFREG